METCDTSESDTRETRAAPALLPSGVSHEPQPTAPHSTIATHLCRRLSVLHVEEEAVALPLLHIPEHRHRALLHLLQPLQTILHKGPSTGQSRLGAQSG